jgi:hypothetical protein
METLWNDVRCALRTFRANPGLTAVAVLSLAVGIDPFHLPIDRSPPDNTAAVRPAGEPGRSAARVR